jgi:hypothetical protein
VPIKMSEGREAEALTTDAMSARSIVQEYIVPIVTYIQREGQGYYHRLVGTAFFVGSCGIFVTAKHVIEQANAFISKGDAEGWAISGKFPLGTSQDALLPVNGVELAPHGLDVAVGYSNVSVVSPIKFSEAPDAMGLSVATLGYPESALNILPQDFRIRLRTHKGYIQRLMEAEDFPLRDHPNSFELSFNVSHGLSGSPLIAQAGSAAGRAIGICVGSIRTQLVDYAALLVDDNGRRVEEKHLMIESYGIAHDVSPILDWCPSFIRDGTPLRNL